MSKNLTAAWTAIKKMQRELGLMQAVLLIAGDPAGNPFDALTIAPECGRGDCLSCADDAGAGHPCDHSCHGATSPWEHVRDLREQLSLAVSRVEVLERMLLLTGSAAGLERPGQMPPGAGDEELAVALVACSRAGART